MTKRVKLTMAEMDILNQKIIENYSNQDYCKTLLGSKFNMVDKQKYKDMLNILNPNLTKGDK